MTNEFAAVPIIPVEPIEVPYAELAPATLRRVVESYVLREGTDYGEREFTLEEKVAHVMHQLQRGEACITFDPISETINLVPAGASGE